MFVTLFLGFLDVRSGTLSYINAGHPLPYLLRATGQLEKIDGKPQTPLAVRAGIRYQTQTATLGLGDALFACTDGVVEAMNGAGEHYAAGRLEAQLRMAFDTAPETMVRAVKLHIDAFTGDAPKSDDVTMLALRRLTARVVDANSAPDTATPAHLPRATELVIRNDIAQLAILSDAMARIGVEQGFAAKPLIQLQVALDEIVSNVIKYAWPEGGSHEICVRITVGSGQVHVEISDDGRAFDPLGVPPPQPPPPGQRPRPGGVGIHMLRQIMDEIEYARIDGRNCLTLTKQCGVGVQNP